MTSVTAATSAPAIARYVQGKIAIALQDTRVVLLAGPRQAGKTTLARLYASPDRPYLTLDDPATLAAARSDPTGFVRGLKQAVIDEVQRAPDLLLAIKESVDNDQAPGRFLLTGSTNLMAMPRVADSLAGRLEVITLLPFAQAELAGTPGNLLDRLFDGAGLPGVVNPMVGDDLMACVLQGGYPEALRRTSASRRQAWLQDYVALILDRDVRDIANIDQLDRMPRLLDVLAAHAGQLVNHSSYGAALGLTTPTAQKYVGILERLFLLRQVPPWSSNAVSRLTKTPKLHFLDTGLLAALRDTTASQLQKDRTGYGPLLENFVVSEVLKLITWSDKRVRISHFRTKEQDEVDLVLEDRRGRVIGIEVKASATVRPQDLRGLRQLQAAVGNKFVHGLVLHDHDRITPFDEKLHAAPVSMLWQG
ncbi:ATP-binding protein [Rhodoferax fermentans]|uniref:AAA family ATPase n=1 Tax=Rhodoferax fermentans TaxID=28066 RepID=A0A1T1ASC7_RHOFE|nr:ATP-binding protein [Rhodoferax fermentans]MBK1684084.1 AAA family ATPase [Rhodoferax fermentans]OOV06967.1 AAA family ATPase [Rhodoferax fermentans]